MCNIWLKTTGTIPISGLLSQTWLGLEYESRLGECSEGPWLEWSGFLDYGPWLAAVPRQYLSVVAAHWMADKDCLRSVIYQVFGGFGPTLTISQGFIIFIFLSNDVAYLRVRLTALKSSLNIR